VDVATPVVVTEVFFATAVLPAAGVADLFAVAGLAAVLAAAVLLDVRFFFFFLAGADVVSVEVVAASAAVSRTVIARVMDRKYGIKRRNVFIR
jgi:hypothetical protein